MNLWRHHWLVVFHWGLSDSKCPQVSSSLLSILVNLNNAVVSMVSILPLIFYSASPFSKPFRTVPSVPNIIDITISFIFYRFFCCLTRSKYLFIFLLYLISTLWSMGTAKFTKFFFFVKWYEVWSSVKNWVISKSQKILYVF